MKVLKQTFSQIVFVLQLISINSLEISAKRKYLLINLKIKV
jgi:hypothetical protein